MEQSSPTARRLWPTPRFWNIAVRTLHIVVTAGLFGGHVFEASREQLVPWLYAAIATGAVLVLLEAYPSPRWLVEVRGLAVLAKLALLLLIPWFWPQRVGLLIAVLVLASAGSHMPRRWRHFALGARPLPDVGSPVAESTRSA